MTSQSETRSHARHTDHARGPRSHDSRMRSNTQQPQLSPVDGEAWSYDVATPAHKQVLFAD